MIAENAGLTLKNTKDEMVARIEDLRKEFGIEKPQGEAELVTIQKKHLLAIIAELEAQFDTSKQEVTAGEIVADDFDPITDPPVTVEELARVKAKIEASVPELLEKLRAATTQLERKKIRAQLRAAGYRLSDHKPTRADKELKSKQKAAKKGGTKKSK